METGPGAGTISYLFFAGISAHAFFCYIAPLRRGREEYFMLTSNTALFHTKTAGPIRCVLADDHEMLRYGVRRLLEDASDFAVVGEASDAADALKLALEHRPDLVLLDISMPGMSSFEAGTSDRRALPGHAYCVSDHA